jgi:hypothetical protein
MTRKGLPHSEIPGSKPVCGSPGLIAACHVLHRLCAPRHPPSTLSSLTIKYLRRVVCILIYPILLSKTSITRIKRPSRDSRGPFHPSIRRRSLCELRWSVSFRWWSRSGSNRRPTACKAAALPAELRPRVLPALGPASPLPARPPKLRGSEGGWWAWVDLNYRPHAYQACALTN